MCTMCFTSVQPCDRSQDAEGASRTLCPAIAPREAKDALALPKQLRAQLPDAPEHAA